MKRGWIARFAAVGVAAVALAAGVASGQDGVGGGRRIPPPRAEFATDGRWVAVFEHGAVAADHELASQAGVEILRAGGNAVDAAVATSLALSVVRPYSCGIGGGGFMLVHLPEHPKLGRVDVAINYREQSPGEIDPLYFTREENRPPWDVHATTHGGKAVCIPGTVAGLLHALERYGTLDRKTVFAPAIRLADEGFAADRHYVESAQEVLSFLRGDDSKEAEPGMGGPGGGARVGFDGARTARFAFVFERFLGRGEVKAGDIIKLPEQAKALRMIAEGGADAFYRGDIARAMVEAVRRDGGVLTMEDLANFRVEESAPLRVAYRGRLVLSMPPPSSGGIAISEILGILDRRPEDLRALGHNSPLYMHLVVEAMKHAFADRARVLADVDMPIDVLLSDRSLRKMAESIDPGRTQAPDRYGTSPQLPRDAGTSHFSVVDGRGGAVSCTETVNLIFGSLLDVPGYGFVLNNEMDDFLTRPGEPNAFGLVQSEANLPGPGKRPLSSMSPVIVMEGSDGGGEPVLVAGASGGPRITSSTAQVVLNVLVFDMGAGRAVALPRAHHQWMPDELALEPTMRGGAWEAALEAMGHKIAEKPNVGCVQLIRKVKGGWQAASDPRKGGAPAGF